MSRIGKQPVLYPAGVKVELKERTIKVAGPKGELTFTHHPLVTVQHDSAGKKIEVTRSNDERLSRSIHGLTRNLIKNMVEGVTKGYEKRLKIEGVGYQARLDGKKLVLVVGYANAIEKTPPEGVKVQVADQNTTIIVTGADKQKVGQFAAEVRASRKPEPYKGKGIRYENEQVRRKEGKSFASGG
jgi:large subunit ribosomal protein L6